MLQLTKVISNAVEKSKRIVKFLRFGLRDTQTAIQVTPYGVDSNPVKDMIAVYAPTNTKGDTVIIGYINKNNLADLGEFRAFSTDANGALKIYVWLKNDGTIELGGGAKNLARFQELKSGFDQLKQDLNTLISTFNSHVHTGVQTGPGSSGPTPTGGTASTASIDSAKIDEVKTL